MKRPRAVVASDGHAIKSQKLAEGDKAEAGKTKRMGLVSKEYVDLLRKDDAPRVRTPDNFTGPQADVFRELAARGTALMEGLRAHNAYIVEQYDAHGQVEIEMEDDESWDSWLNDPENWILQVVRKRAAAKMKMEASA